MVKLLKKSLIKVYIQLYSFSELPPTSEN